MLFRYPKYSKEDKTGELIFTDNRYFVMGCYSYSCFHVNLAARRKN